MLNDTELQVGLLYSKSGAKNEPYRFGEGNADERRRANCHCVDGSDADCTGKT